MLGPGLEILLLDNELLIDNGLEILLLKLEDEGKASKCQKSEETEAL